MSGNKILLIVAITAIALAVAVSGCTFSKDISIGGNTTTAAPTKTTASTAASNAPAGPTVAPGTYKVTTEGKNVKITGNGVVKTTAFQLPENWYGLKTTYAGSTQAGRMDYLDIVILDEAGDTSLGLMHERKGIYASYYGTHYPMTTSTGTTNTFYLQTREPTVGAWTVEFIAPPAESSVATAPKTFTGKGSAIVGPVKLPTATGTAKIEYNGPAESYGITFYQQDINYPEYPSFFMYMSDPYVYGSDASYSKTVDINNFDPNLMLLMEVNAPADGSWSITISPA